MDPLNQYLKLNSSIGTSVGIPINMFISACKKREIKFLKFNENWISFLANVHCCKIISVSKLKKAQE